MIELPKTGLFRIVLLCPQANPFGKHPVAAASGCGINVEKWSSRKQHNIFIRGQRPDLICAENESTDTVWQVSAEVDSSMRKRSKCNHTATHLLQAALKKVLPNNVAQQGSSVTFDSLRFDFNLDRPMKVLL